MSDRTYRATIVAAIITVIGSVAVAFIGNWDKFVATPTIVPEPPAARAIEPRPPERAETARPGDAAPPIGQEAPAVSIAGLWMDVNNPGAGSQITQRGSAFDYESWGVLPNGIRYESKGSGTVTGQSVRSTYTTRYPNGWISGGRCSGTVSSDGRRMTSTCDDDNLGTFVIAGVRQ